MGVRKSHTKITAEIIQTVNKYLEDPKYKNLTDAEIATLTHISLASLGRIKHGDYDHLLKPNEPTPLHDVVHATIDYSELQHLFACEQLVKDMLDVTKLSDLGEDELYFPRRILNNLFKKYVPDLAAERLEYLKTEATDSYIS